MRATIVAAADANYFSELNGLIASIHEHRPNSAIDISIIDLGLSADQLRQLGALVNGVAGARWDFDFPTRAATPRWMQEMTVRPFLASYFPGYDLYIWLDADSWLQDWRAIDLLVAGAAESDLAIVPEIHCVYQHLYQPGGHPWMNNCYETAFGHETALNLWMRPVFNSGVFAIRRDSPWWGTYAEYMRRAFQRPVNKWSEQCALNVGIYAKGGAFQPLPAWCNWICALAIPWVDPNLRCLCEPLRPYEKLSVVHVTGANEPGLKLRTIDGEFLEMPLDYHGFRAAVNKL